MISYLKGTILNKTPDMITICVHDAIGYEIWMTPQEIQKLAIGDKKEVFCYHHISDRTQELYGFRTRDQRELFTLLISHVNGVGPKLALKLLTKIDSDITQKAVAQGDALILEQCGIGKKTAEKIIVGLRGRLENTGAPINPTLDSSAYREAFEALLSLGYTKLETQHALREIDVKEKSAEHVVKEALRTLA